MRVNNRWLLILAVIIAALWPVWRWFVLRTFDGSDDPYGIVAIGIAAIYGWKVRREIRFTNRQTLVAVGLLTIYALSFSFMPPLFRAVLGIGMIIALFGPAFRKPGIVGLLFLSLPIVASLQFYFGYPLRLLSAETAHLFLSLANYDVIRTGTDLIFKGAVIGVDAPCSGIQMLFTSGLVVASMAAFSRLSWGKTALLSVIGILAAVFGNTLRVTALFFKESEIWQLPEWTHQGIGMLIFAIVVSVLVVIGGKLAGTSSQFPSEKRAFFQPSKTAFGLTIVIGLIAAAVPFSDKIGIAVSETSALSEWPKKWEGEWLEPMPLTRQEAAFAEGFPGELGVFQAGKNRVILRSVTRATRKLHSSSDCLRATGYEILDHRPGDFRAVKDQTEYAVHERIYEGGGVSLKREWTEVSSWFWDAALNRTEGPWLTITVISPNGKNHDRIGQVQ